MAIRQSTASSTAAPARGSQARTLESIRERLLAEFPVTERRLTLNGVTTAVLEGGEGPPAVLLHGPGAYAAHWLSIIPNLAKTHRVIAADLPGHGESGMFAYPPTPGVMAAWLDDLIECTCESRPVLVGSTLGGALAARFAAESSERIAALVLVDTLGLTEFRPTPEFGAALNDYLSAPGALTHDRLWSYCVFDLAALRTRMGEQFDLIRAYSLDRVNTRERLSALLTLMEQFGAPAIPLDSLARIDVPTTLIWGRHDRATPLSVAEQACQRFGWELLIIEDAADDPALEQPGAFLQALHRALGTEKNQEEGI